MITVANRIVLHSIRNPRPAGQEFSEARQVLFAQFVNTVYLSGSGDTGMLVYVLMTVLNALTMGTFFRSEIAV